MGITEHPGCCRILESPHIRNMMWLYGVLLLVASALGQRLRYLPAPPVTTSAEPVSSYIPIHPSNHSFITIHPSSHTRILLHPSSHTRILLHSSSHTCSHLHSSSHTCSHLHPSYHHTSQGVSSSKR